MNRIILASESPRRQALLRHIFDRFENIPSTAAEETKEKKPGRMVQELALIKARDVAARADGKAAVIGADTMVFIGETALGKPKDERAAFKMLMQLKGKRHDVYTGIAVIDTGTGRHRTAAEATAVYFDDMSKDEIRAYIETGEPMDKAGAYGIQGEGSRYIRRIEGCFFNVMGLPLNRLYRLLQDMQLL